MERSYPAMKAQGSISPWRADHNLAADRVLLKMLRQGERGKQLDFGEAFEKLKKSL